ncbi:MAG TPA: hypothetical protein VM287_07585, partial [Egibacteraceae bacterium]|nr:hypothetical protein [Egibacteraceae bacterium]
LLAPPLESVRSGELPALPERPRPELPEPVPAPPEPEVPAPAGRDGPGVELPVEVPLLAHRRGT